MTRPDDMPMPDLRQVQALDQWLDDLTAGGAGGAVAPPDDLDPDTARSVRRLHDLSGAATAVAMARSAPSSAWTALLAGAAQPGRAEGGTAPLADAARPIARPARRGASPPSSASPLPVAEPRPICAGPGAARRSRWRRIGQRSMGWAATLLLVGLIGLSGFAVYLSAPGEDSPTGAPGIAAATPTLAPAERPADTRDVYPQDCVQPAADFDAVMALTRVPRDEWSPAFQAEQFAVVTSDHPPRPADLMRNLRFGEPPDAATMDAVTATFGQYTSCQPLNAATLTTGDFWLRAAFATPGGGATILRLWEQQRQTDSAQYHEPTSSLPGQPFPSPRTGQPTLFALYGFQTLSDGRVAAFLTTGDTFAPDVFPAYDESGLVVMTPDGTGGWLVDQVIYPSVAG